MLHFVFIVDHSRQYSWLEAIPCQMCSFQLPPCLACQQSLKASYTCFFFYANKHTKPAQLPLFMPLTRVLQLSFSHESQTLLKVIPRYSFLLLWRESVSCCFLTGHCLYLRKCLFLLPLPIESLCVPSALYTFPPPVPFPKVGTSQCCQHVVSANKNVCWVIVSPAKTYVS